MIHVAKAELLSAYKAAFSAAGMTVGEADDAALVAIWLDACGLDAISRIPPALARRSKRKQIRPTVIEERDSPIRLDCRGASVLEVGAALVDYGIAEHRRSDVKGVSISNAADGEFLVGLASILLLRGVDGVVERTSESSGFERLSVANGKAVWSRTAGQGDGGESDLIDFTLCFDSLGGAPDRTGVVSRELVPERRQGYSVSESSWNALLQFANLMLVPESEASRVAGAGIGADED